MAMAAREDDVGARLLGHTSLDTDTSDGVVDGSEQVRVPVSDHPDQGDL